MAVLPDNDRAAVWAKWMQENVELCGALTKADLRAAVNAADQWSDDNDTSFNTALPQPARGVLTAKQKARLLMEIIRRRFEVT